MLLIHSLAVNTCSVISIKTLEVNPRQMSVSQVVSAELQGVGVIPSRSESDLLWAHGQCLQLGFLSAVDSKEKKASYMPPKVLSLQMCLLKGC